MQNWIKMTTRQISADFNLSVADEKIIADVISSTIQDFYKGTKVTARQIINRAFDVFGKPRVPSSELFQAVCIIAKAFPEYLNRA